MRKGLGGSRSRAAHATTSTLAEIAAAQVVSATDAAETPGEAADVAAHAIDKKTSTPPPWGGHVAGWRRSGGGKRGGKRYGSLASINCGGSGSGHRLLGGIARGGRRRRGGRRKHENIGPYRSCSQHAAGRWFIGRG